VGSPDSALSHLVSCRAAYGCTDLAAAWPHGGTGLGLVGSVEIFSPSLYRPVLQEEDNGSEEVVYLGGPLLVAMRIEGWDNDALAAVFPSSTTVSSDRVLQWPGSGTQPGSPVTALSKLVITPDDSTKPGAIIYSAAPMIRLSEAMRLQAKSFLYVPVIFEGLPDASGRRGCKGKFSRLSGLLA
jgi:hypothetical protein